jgi:tetratricopeptide (TPR) repeat protein
MSASQSSNIFGNYNVVVQAHGDGIAVNVNQAHLTLVAWHRQQSKAEKVLDLLNPFVRAIPLVGRESAKADLENWLASNPTISVRCLVGSSGSGKTRLGIELCESAEQQKWFAGFVNHKELTRFANQQNLSDWGWSRNTLVVVDYAAARARVLRQWLVELAQNAPSAGKSLRLLLLERHADPAIGWWHDLVTPGTFSEEPLTRLPDPVTPVALPSIVTVDQRREILSYVMAEASRLLKKAPVLKPPAPGKDAEFDRKLADPAIAFAPLYLIMSGVTAVQEGIPTLLTRGRAEMAQRIATDELARIGKLARDRNLNPDLLKYLVAGVTLAGGYSREELTDCIAQEHAALGHGQQDDGRLADAVCDVLGVLDRVPPILPDLIGEAALLEQLRKLPKQGQAHFVTRWFARVNAPVAATLIRTAQDYTATEEPLRWFDAVVDKHQDLDSLWEISRQLPEETLLFRDRSVKISEDIVKRLTAEPSKNTNRSVLASALNNLANRLIAVGQREKALARAQEAVDIRRELAAAQPIGFRTDLAGSLHNLANMLSALGRREEALERAQETVDLYRESAADHPDAFRPELAGSLNNLANRLIALGRREEALARAQEAVDIRRELAVAQPDAFRPKLAGSLNNLANILGALGRREEALARAQEAVDIRRELAAAQPDFFRPDLAMSLNNLATRLGELGRQEESLARARESAELYRELAAAQPDSFRPNLAGSLNNLAIGLSDLGLREEALARAREAAELHRELAAARPDSFRPDLAMSLNTLAIRLSDLGLREEALARAQEAAELYRELVATRPDAFRPDLAMSLITLANRLSDLGLREEALARAQEAVDIRRELAATQPDAFRPDLALSLNTLANMLGVLGRKEEALARAREAAELYRELAEAQPDAFQPDLAMSLSVLADCLESLSTLDDAVQCDAEAVRVLGPIFLSATARFAKVMAAIVSLYIRRLKTLNREPQPDVADLLVRIVAVLNADTPPSRQRGS